MHGVLFISLTVELTMLRMQISMRPMKRVRLNSLIFRHYTRSALLSILTIELLLLAMYFGINTYIGKQSEKTLKKEVEAVMPNLVALSASSISSDFALIKRQTTHFATSHENVIAHSEAFSVIGEKPVFLRSPNGSLYQSNLNKGSSMFIPASGKTGPREMMIAEKTAVLNPLYRYMVEGTPNVVASYFNTPGDMNRLYPFMENVWEQYPPDFDMEDFNFFYLANESYNPSRKPVWTGVYLDPAGQGWMLSCIAPVYVGDTLEGVVGLDVTIEKIVNSILNMSLPWGSSAFLADDKGMILAMSPKVEELLGLHELKSHLYLQAVSKELLKPEEFSLLKITDPKLNAGFRELYSSKGALLEIPSMNGPVFVAQGIIPETGWRIFVVIRQAEVFESLDRLARLTSLIGYAAVGGMFVFYVVFFLFLRNRAHAMAGAIARPMEQLTLATAVIGTRASDVTIPSSGIEEIDKLTANFNEMALELDRRSVELVDGRVRAEMKGKEAELAYTRGLYESASGYLHNVGNAITRMESHLLDLNDVVKGSGQYPEVFRRLEQGGDKADETLQRFKEVLLGKIAPTVSSATAGISRIKDSIKHTISSQQSGFRAASRLQPEQFSLSNLLEELCPHFQRENITLHLNIEPGIMISNFPERIRQGVDNLLKNSLEAIPGRGTITLSCRALPDGAELIVEDDGVGIASGNLPHVLSAGFTTKTTGHGLGLHSFAVFLSSAGGQLTVGSEGEGKGTCVKVDIQNVK